MSERTRVTEPSPATQTSGLPMVLAVEFRSVKSSRRMPAMLFSATTATYGSRLAARWAARRAADNVRIVSG